MKLGGLDPPQQSAAAKDAVPAVETKAAPVCRTYLEAPRGALRAATVHPGAYNQHSIKDVCTVPKATASDHLARRTLLEVPVKRVSVQPVPQLRRCRWDVSMV
ncbi:uncharacterized protein LOC144108189 [Amblyomma americanum]